MSDSTTLLLETLSFLADNRATGEHYETARDYRTQELFVRLTNVPYSDGMDSIDIKTKERLDSYKDLVQKCAKYNLESFASTYLYCLLYGDLLPYSSAVQTFGDMPLPEEFKEFYETKEDYEARLAKVEEFSKIWYSEPKHDEITTSVSERWRNSGLYKFLMFLFR